MSKAKRQARTLARRRKRDKAKASGSPRAVATVAAPGIESAPSGGQAVASPGELPWYARPPKKRLGALVTVGVLLASWLGYLLWVAIYHGRNAGQ